MKKIETLSTIEGRKVLIELFKELRYERQLSGFNVLLQTWRICVRERDLFRYMKDEVSVLHPLGFFSGTTLWMQEIVNRFYFTTINSFVYLGAAILLALIGIRRFSDHVSEQMIIGGVAFEAFMLIFMFIIMLFSPNDEVLESGSKDDKSSSDDLIIEIGEIGRDIAASVTKLDDVTGAITQLIRQQVDMINLINQIAKNSADAVSPNPQMLDTMRVTNAVLEEFKNTVESFNAAAEKLKREEIELAVKKEVERIIVSRVNANLE